MAMKVIFPIIGNILMYCGAYASNYRFRAEKYIPMQWSISGSVNWSAPRLIAFYLLPVMSSAFIIVYCTFPALFVPKPGSEKLAVLAPSIVVTTFAIVQLVHFWGVSKTIQ